MDTWVTVTAYFLIALAAKTHGILSIYTLKHAVGLLRDRVRLCYNLQWGNLHA